MSFLHTVRMTLRRMGVDLHRYRPSQSPEACLVQLLRMQRVDTVLDVGANDGGFATGLLSGGFDGTILSFEPLPQAHAALVKASAGHPRWSALPRMALGEGEHSTHINVAGNSKSSSLLAMEALHEGAAPQSRYVRQELVQVQRLDAVKEPHLAAAQRIHLKIDTQGYELPVLKGAEGCWSRIVSVQMEMSLAPLYQGQALFRELLDWMDARGFELCGVLPGFVDESSGKMLQVDGLFTRRSA